MRLKLAAAAALLAVSVPALAGYSIVPHGGTVIAAGSFSVTPGDDWNRDSRHPVKKAEVWTLDGPPLNELTFVGGLVAGETLYRDSNKKDRPLPKMAADIGLTDIPEFFESSTRIALNTSLFEMGSIKPAKLGNVDAIRFTYRYAVTGAQLVRNGVAIGAVVKGQLYLMHFNAPRTFYFDRDAPRAEAIMASAHL